MLRQARRRGDNRGMRKDLRFSSRPLAGDAALAQPAMRELARVGMGEAMRYWEPRRIFYNVVILLVIGASCMISGGGASLTLALREMLSLLLILMTANVVYCIAYVLDLYALLYGGAERGWHFLRPLCYYGGLILAAGLTRLWAIAIFA